jgi:GT2 family glycosyltransferase
MLKILTLNWNGKDKLERLTPTLINSLNRIDYEWWVKDNGSKDGSVEFLESLSNTHLVKTSHNRDSYASGMNILFEAANCLDEDLILFLNNDLYFGNTNSIKNMIELINKDNVGLVGARILYPDSNRLQHAGVIISEKYNYLPYHYRHKEFSDLQSCRDREFQIVTAACALTKGSYYKQVCDNKSGRKGFCEDYYWMYEDVDFALSVKYRLNKSVVYCGRTEIYHEESYSLKKNPVNKMMMPQNIETYRRKWASIVKEDHKGYLNDINFKIFC